MATNMDEIITSTLANNLIQLSTLNMGNIIQTASDSRNLSSANMQSLMKRISELDTQEGSAALPFARVNTAAASHTESNHLVRSIIDALVAKGAGA